MKVKTASAKYQTQERGKTSGFFSKCTNVFIMNNAHMGVWSQIQRKANTLKGLAVLVLDGEVCDEWQENYDFHQIVTTQVWVRKKDSDTLLMFSAITHSLVVFKFVFAVICKRKRLSYPSILFGYIHKVCKWIWYWAKYLIGCVMIYFTSKYPFFFPKAFKMNVMIQLEFVVHHRPQHSRYLLKVQRPQIWMFILGKMLVITHLPWYY